MLSNWKHSNVLKRKSSGNYLIEGSHSGTKELLHLYIPWDTTLKFNYMFEVKDIIKKQGSALIPFMEINGESKILSAEQTRRIQNQINRGEETHLIMSNFESIHVFKVKNIYPKQEENHPSDKLCFIKEVENDYSHWIEVDDVFILDVDFHKREGAIFSRLIDFFEDPITTRIFKPEHLLELRETTTRPSQKRLVDLERRFTYDYFIKACELKENVFYHDWSSLSYKTQHLLVISSLRKHESIFSKNLEKWGLLKHSFHSYRQAVYAEINDLYVEPVIHAIRTQSKLFELWNSKSSFRCHHFNLLVLDLLEQKKEGIDNVEDLELYFKNIKSFLFSTGGYFSRKIDKAESLVIEKFLSKQGTLIRSPKCGHMMLKLASLDKLYQWTQDTASEKDKLDHFNLKISHLLNLMLSNIYDNNILFLLIEEKTSRSFRFKSLDDEVKSLFDTSDLSKAA